MRHVMLSWIDAMNLHTEQKPTKGHSHCQCFELELCEQYKKIAFNVKECVVWRTRARANFQENEPNNFIAKWHAFACELK